MWLIILSNQLWIVALVSHYLTNKLIQYRHLLGREVLRAPTLNRSYYVVLAFVSECYPPP